MGPTSSTRTLASVGRLGDQRYVAYPEPQPVSVEFSVRFAIPGTLSDLQLDHAALIAGALVRPSRQRAAAALAGFAYPRRARWLRSELTQLLALGGHEFHWAVRDEDFVEDSRTSSWIWSQASKSGFGRGTPPRWL